MTREEFDLLVRRIEKRYAGRPRQLRRAVVFWALVGYGWFAGWFLLVILLAGGLGVTGWAAGPNGVLLDILAGVAFIGGILLAWRIVRVKLPPIEGRRVTAAEAPALFNALAALRAKLGAIPVHRVLVVTGLNASVVQQPRFGVFGWWRNYLLLGMPLLEVLTENEFIAVLAHEFAHLSRQHGRLSHWLYRVRKSWERIFASFQQPNARRGISLRAVTAWFARWFWPRFNAHAFVLSRTHEYEADRVAADVAGAPAMMSALSRLAATHEFLDAKFWPGIRQLAAEKPEPPGDLLGYFRSTHEAALAAELEEYWRAELRGVSSNADTHPSLNERLTALGWRGADLLTPIAGPSASAALLGGALEPVRADVNAAWRKEITKTWTEHNTRASILQRRLGSIPIAASANAVDADTLWDKACIRAELEKSSQIEPLLHEILALRPTHTGALMALGDSLLGRNDPEGAQYLERAMAADEECIPRAGEMLLEYYRRAGDTESMRKTRLRIDAYETTLAASLEERNTLSPGDKLIPHGLTQAELEPLL
ncbi:MAG TPA: M48 family metallopeptidase, partial [Chthoniobacteraceae bacterium]|nr:M48 family metallopeptidase [Chthoniobacteraceae bacterium]